MNMSQSVLSPEYAAENIGPRAYGTAITFAILDITFVSLRFISRKVSRLQLATDDFLIVSALIICLGLSACAIVEVEIAGVGRHLPVVLVTDPEAVKNWAKCAYAVEQLYCVAVSLPKLSIAATYLRIFTEMPYRIATLLVCGVMIANATAGIIASLAQCQPFSARWNLQIMLHNPTSVCIDSIQYWRWISFPNIVTDVALLILPLPVVWRLKMSTAQKIALSLVFVTGSVGIIAAIVRFSYFFSIDVLTDGTYVTANLLVWTIVEPGVYLMAACLPAIRPLFLATVSQLNRITGLRSYGITASTSKARDNKSDEAHIHVSNEIQLEWSQIDAESR
ncbi:hypothetical protein EJ05DRAFT_473390 [Pseudovirgaria hyperparasitica]|uniref:Rhodopsin domain-containing protein n=1 Tax=Pseudovirgaria hyperparasitica TaxID=470096 RepID=A0A6A6WFK1_9PEZI|nr:uncharacterized protein EJ05DRAFT_473390 [Pseudovirgaria hyperparasitica]KAF2760780.1 hypothetical protein EJ05DRAFT_473390 [Pseudovirgaria hyperparasitica]